MLIEIIDNQDDWMNIRIDDQLWYEGHISSFHNGILRELLEQIMPKGTTVIHDDDPSNFDEE